MSEPARPILRYHGGKWRIAPWIIDHMPPHGVYVEAFGGGGSVLLRKPRAHGEVYNDLDDEVVNVFRVLRDPDAAARLAELAALTPFSRVEFEQAYAPTEDPIERARRTVVRATMGFGTSGLRGRKTGFRARTYAQNGTSAMAWTNWPDEIPAFVERLRGVTIEHRCAFDLLRAHDAPGVLHYVDPPYLPETRTAHQGRRYADGSAAYAHEMEPEAHVALLDLLDQLEGMVLLSGYPSDLYAGRLPGWTCMARDAWADGAKARTECLWLNPAARGALEQARYRNMTLSLEPQ